jgi:hypothetical protein
VDELGLSTTMRISSEMASITSISAIASDPILQACRNPSFVLDLIGSFGRCAPKPTCHVVSISVGMPWSRLEKLQAFRSAIAAKRRLGDDWHG